MVNVNEEREWGSNTNNNFDLSITDTNTYSFPDTSQGDGFSVKQLNRIGVKGGSVEVSYMTDNG